jgi:integrase
MLEAYRRGTTWWAKGRVEYAGKAVSEYYRCSTGFSEEQAAIEWCRDEENRRIRGFLLGDDKAEKPLTFAGAVMLYDANPKTAQYLEPLVIAIGDMLLIEITPKIIRDLGAALYPGAGTRTWTRQVVSPARAVMNNAHDLGKGPAIRIKGYDRREALGQDQARGSSGRPKHEPGSWEWLLRFRAHADQRCAALALVMFATGARISQAIAMHPKDHLDLQHGRICIPAAKGLGDRWLEVPPEVVADLANLPILYPRGWARTAANARVFGYADRSSPRKEWARACKAAGIAQLPFHSAGRHGFGQEMNVRQRIDEKAASKFGGWADTALMKRTYTHAEEEADKVHRAFRDGLAEAERKTRLRLGRVAGA